MNTLGASGVLFWAETLKQVPANSRHAKIFIVMNLSRFTEGRTDLVFELISAGHPASTADSDGVSLIRWCAYHGDVSAIRFLLSKGEKLESLGENFDLNGACFHGYPNLCEYLIEQGADVNFSMAETGETCLHATICKPTAGRFDAVIEILLAHGADPNRATLPDAETEGFMRDCRTKAETPLHRAAAFGSRRAIQMLLDAGANLKARDQHGDTPLSWASWYLRPDHILQMLCYGDFHISAQRVKHSLEPA